MIFSWETGKKQLVSLIFKIYVQTCIIKWTVKLFKEVCFCSVMKGIQGGAGVELSVTCAY